MSFTNLPSPDQNNPFNESDVRTKAQMSARKVLGYGHSDLADDIALQIVEKAWERRGSIRNPGAWASRCAKYLTLNIIKKDLVRFVSIDDEEYQPTGLRQTDKTIYHGEIEEIRAGISNLRDVFCRLLASFSDENRAIFFGLYRDRLSSDMIAEKLGLKAATVRRRWCRMLPKLHHNLLYEIQKSPIGRELFFPALQDPENFLAFVKIAIEDPKLFDEFLTAFLSN